jgi:gamma-glutamyl-gamma-aminobutyrate hydrolase PuuD
LRIGLTQRVLYHKGRAYDALEHAWYRFLDGHKLIFIPNTLEQDFTELTEQLDCVIITGGDDSAPRRATELKLASSMMLAFKPILGICHGAFLLTDALGGEVNAVMGHSDIAHTVHYAGRDIKVNSHHNLAITQLHSTGECLATDHQGNCEAWIDGRMAGIVWHPERMDNPFVPSEIQQVMKL